MFRTPLNTLTNMSSNTDSVCERTGLAGHPSDGRRESADRPLTWFIRLVALVVALTSAVLFLQWRAGAFTSEFGSYPDEASHFMSGMLVHDYLHAGLPRPAMAFAESFYLRYPYLAIGHWPPLFYALEGGWMYLFGPTRFAVILLMALITSALSLVVFVAVRKQYGDAAGLISALVLIAVPIMQQYAGMVMMDTLLALLTFLAVLAFGSYIDTERPASAIAFGILSTLALMTKANAAFLALLPLFGILLSRRFSLLRRKAFWLSGILVAGAALPWHLQTMRLITPTFQGTFGWTFAWHASRFYAGLLLQSLGPGFVLLAGIGFAMKVIRPGWNGSVGGYWAAQGAMLASYSFFYFAVPAGIEGRYLIALFPSILLFVNAGAEYLSSALGSTRALARIRSSVLVASSLIFLVFCFRIPSKTNYGFAEAAGAIFGQHRAGPRLLLVSTETLVGEGVFVSEAALHQTGQDDVILRASKVLADEDWNKTRYQPRYGSETELSACLKEVAPDFIILDTTPGIRSYIHHEQLRAMVTHNPGEWRLLGHYVPSTRPAAAAAGVDVYAHVEGAHLGTATPPLRRISTNLRGSAPEWPITVHLVCSGSSRSAGD